MNKLSSVLHSLNKPNTGYIVWLTTLNDRSHCLYAVVLPRQENHKEYISIVIPSSAKYVADFIMMYF